MVLNDLDGLIKTVKSVRSQTLPPHELIVIDGGSTDGSREYLSENEHLFSKFVSQPDRGIYDAMNKGVGLASGNWLLFLNAGDCLHDPETLRNCSGLINENADIIYGDVLLRFNQGEQRLHANHAANSFHHQGLIYRKSLHEKYGPYLVASHVTISDYLFFSQMTEERWIKYRELFAICDATGVSSRPDSFYQRLTIDFLLRRRGRVLTAFALLAYPFYRVIVRPFVRMMTLDRKQSAVPGS